MANFSILKRMICLDTLAKKFKSQNGFGSRIYELLFGLKKMFADLISYFSWDILILNRHFAVGPLRSSKVFFKINF